MIIELQTHHRNLRKHINMEEETVLIFPLQKDNHTNNSISD